MKNKSLLNSFKYAFRGISSAFLSERNMRIHVFIMVLVIIFGNFFKISFYEWLICISCFALVIGAEMFNTSIEVVVDIVMPKEDARAKLAKDVAAGGVLVFAIASAFIGLSIFIPKIIDYIK